MAQIFQPGKNKTDKPKLAVGQKLSVQIERLDHLGQGVSSNHEPVMFVSGGLPGDTLTVNVIEHKPRFQKANIISVDKASEHRQEAFCVHYEHCGGCQTQHCEPHAMLDFKQQAIDELIKRSPLTKEQPKGRNSSISSPLKSKQTRKTIGDELTQLPWQAPLNSAAQGYRRKTRLSVDARHAQKTVIGFRAKQSNQVIDIQQCPILVPTLQALFVPLKQMLLGLKNPSAVGHVSLLSGDNLNQITLRVVKTLSQQDRIKLVEFGEKYQCQMLLEDNQHQFEALNFVDQTLSYSLDDLYISLQPDDFVQVNGVLNEQMVAQAMNWLALNEDDHVLDLFCGVGNFSLPLAKRCQAVVAIEGVSKMVQRGIGNAQQNGIENIHFLHGDLADDRVLMQPEVRKCNKILLDPAREGAPAVADRIGRMKASHVLYVSCNPASFARDAGVMIGQGYTLDKVSVMDMFPQTAHTELMALFVRQSNKKKN